MWGGVVGCFFFFFCGRDGWKGVWYTWRKGEGREGRGGGKGDNGWMLGDCVFAVSDIVFFLGIMSCFMDGRYPPTHTYFSFCRRGVGVWLMGYGYLWVGLGLGLIDWEN